MKNWKGIIQALFCVGMTILLYIGNMPTEQPVTVYGMQLVAESVAEPVMEPVEVQTTTPPPTPTPEVTATPVPEITVAPEVTATPQPVETETPQPVATATPAPEEEVSEYVDFAIADVRNYVNVRSLPSTEGDVVGKLYSGAVAQIEEAAGEEGDWFKIISGNVEGYVKGEYFIHGQEAAEVMDSYVVKYAQVQVKKLNVRADQSTSAKKVGYLENEETVKVLEDCGEWLKVQYTADTEGYLSAEYVMIMESYSYAVSPEEEKAQKALDKVREARKPAEKAVKEETTEEIIQVVPPAVTYTSNEELRKEIINYALQFVGNKYINGGSSLTKGTDCSGFTCLILKEFGYSISRTPSGQYTGAGRSIDISEIQPGDIVCYSSNGGKSCTHVAFYIGDGQIVHSANSRKGVIVSSIEFEPIIGVRNVID